MCVQCSRPTLIGRVSRLVGRLVPVIVLALLPKCPLCFAAYFTLLTGVGLSLTAATWLRAGLLIVCWVALVCIAIRLLAPAGKFTAFRPGEPS